MSTVVFIGQEKPEKRLLHKLLYKYYPSAEMKEQIIKDLKAHIKDGLEQYDFEIDVKVTLKEYDKEYHPVDKNQCYQEYLNTKTGE